jgi:hypothetical protein
VGGGGRDDWELLGGEEGGRRGIDTEGFGKRKSVGPMAQMHKEELNADVIPLLFFAGFDANIRFMGCNLQYCYCAIKAI